MYHAVLQTYLTGLPTASGTRVAGALGCSRKAVLEERFGGGTGNEAALSGTLLHEMLQVRAEEVVQPLSPLSLTHSKSVIVGLQS